MKWKPVPGLLVAISVLILSLGTPLVAGAQGSTVPMRGAAVSPRVIEFRELARRTAPYTGPRMERKESHFEEADSLVELLKKRRLAPSLNDIGQLTIDSNGGGFEVLAPTAGNGFEGISQGPYIPSEPTVAGGPLNVFTAGNVSVTVTDKDGSNRVETDGQAFFGVPAAEGAISDAQCYFDALRGRFVALCFTQGTSPSNYSNFYLAISKTNDARGAWWLYKFDMTKDGTTSTANWSDYQALGISEDKLAMTGQQFTFASDSYVYQKIRVIDRAAAYSGATVTYVDFANFAPPPGGDTSDNFVTKAARNLTAGDATLHCLCVRTGSGTNVTYRTITGPPSAPVLSAGVRVTVGSYSAPPDAVQKGSGTLVATNDCRPSDFYVRNGVLVCAWHTAANIGGTVSAIRLFRMRTSDNAVLTDETYGQSGTYYYYPAVTVDSVGTIFLGFDRSSSTEFPSAYATGKRRGDASLQSSVLLKAGLSATAQSRWGDYTGIDNDATLTGPGGAVAWYAGQWTKATNTFGTWINRLSFSYGQVAGTVFDDCDGSAATAGDRSPLAGASLALKQGVSTLATTSSDASGNYNFGYLETGTYDVVVTPPGGANAADAVPGSGGTSQTRISSTDLQVNLTNAQTSTANLFLMTTSHALPVTAGIAPNFKNVGDPGFPLTVTGSGFTACSVVRLDGADRVTSFVNSGQLTANVLATDLGAPGTRNVTVFTPAPGGGTSGAQVLTVSGTPDNSPPLATVTSPVGGEDWTIGSLHNVTWTASDDRGVTSVDLALSTNGGASFPTAIATGIANSGSFAWTLPLTASATARVRVLARDAAGNLGSDSSHTNFAMSGWTIAASAGAGGSIAPSGTVGVADGATPSYTITPDTGYSVSDVLVNGGSVGAVTVFNFPAVHSNQTIAASFAINSYTLGVSVTGSGTVAKSPDQPSYTHGTPVTLTATPSAGWNFQGWGGDTSGSVNPLALVMTRNRSITATFSQNVYTWNQTGTAAFGTAANWTPARNAISSTDVLVFNNGATTTATGVTTQTIAQLLVSGNTTAILQATSAATVTVAGGTGSDLDVATGSTLRLSGAAAVTFALGSSATGNVAGTFNALGGGHRLSALGTGAVVFANGGSCLLGTGFTGNIFGVGSGISALNSVVFQNGSLYVQGAGANPFGATSPNSVVTFQPGSRFRLDAPLTPSVSGRSYADFECNVASTISPTGSAAYSMDSVIVTQGTLNLNMTGGGTLRGSLDVKPSGTLTFSPASGTPVVTFAGTALQTLDILGSFACTSNQILAINNLAGVSLTHTLSIAGTLSFTAGNLVTGASTLIVPSTGSVTGASQGSGWVAGSLRRNFASGASSRAFDIGDATFYSPVTVAVTGAASGFDLTGSTSTPDHPNLATSGLNPAKSLNRWWTMAPSGSPAFTSFDATFSFDPDDLDPGVNTANLAVARYSGAWSSPTTGTRTATSTQATGVTGFGDFALAEPVQLALNVTVVGSGGVGRVPNQAGYSPGTAVQLTATPAPGWTFAGWSGDTTSANNPITLTLYSDKSVTATFTDATAPTVAVTAPNGGEVLTVGSGTSLTWNASDNVGVTLVDLMLSRAGSGGPFSPIASGIANSGTFGWTVTGPPTSDAWLEVIAHDAATNTASDVSDAAFSINGVTGVESGAPVAFALEPVTPNPMRGSGRFAFALPRAAHARLSVVDLQGREVRRLADGEFGPGRHETRIDAGTGETLEAGLYFLRLQSEGRTLVRRFVTVR